MNGLVIKLISFARYSTTLPYLGCKLQIALLDCFAALWQSHALEEGDDVFLPEDALVLLLQVHEGVGGLGVPDVRLASLHTQSQVIADDLQNSAYVSALPAPDPEAADATQIALVHVKAEMRA